MRVSEFTNIYLCDFEFGSTPGNRPVPRCMVVKEHGTGRTIRMWENELRDLRAAPFDIGLNSLFVAYYAPAEMGCFASLGWQMPLRILDLSVEFRNITNGKEVPAGRGLLGAMVYYGLKSISVEEKDEMRALALRGSPYTSVEKRALMDYCESDVLALEKLLPLILENTSLPHALIRGRYTKAVAKMEACGIPVDTETWSAITEGWDGIRSKLIVRIDSAYGVFEGLHFKQEKFEAYLRSSRLPWPRLPSGKLALDDDTFRDMAKVYPQLHDLRELRSALSQLKVTDLSIGKDCRNRTPLWAFGTKTGRNAPSTTQFVFGPSVWIRNLIQPLPGHALVYIDWSGQEYGIGAALSGDERMWDAYASGDPYIRLAIDAALAPEGATKKSHPDIRDVCKVIALATNYGAGPDSLALKINKTPAFTRDLLRRHRELYPKFWEWSDGAINFANLYGRIQTVFGWTYQLPNDKNSRSIRNFPAQGNGAEMLRLACCFATEDGVQVSAPVHDALLIHSTLDGLDGAIWKTTNAMSKASKLVLGGREIRTDVKILKYPDRYQDPRGKVMWNTILGCLGLGGGDRRVALP